ncbi:hypothetical protein MESS2_1050018 [Mesorhizobium metallidurans STM 2683]|uniref:Uncharacterized protein n=1 Tax=Mesorhizobium metallidurans STM 2683 TaxID=1297569 RepID=M5EFT2_9HYPH|nr:hypothetical protein MESS2_1050018 [Mesorhizobium metallidurans STM 2683]
MCRWAACLGEAVFLEDIIAAPCHSLIALSHYAQEAKLPTNGERRRSTLPPLAKALAAASYQNPSTATAATGRRSRHRVSSPSPRPG